MVYFTEEDFEQLIGWIDSPQLLMQWAGPQFQFPLTRNQLMNYVQGANAEESEVYIFKGMDLETNEVIGHICLNKIDRERQSGRIGKVFLHKDFRGSGYGEEMVKQIMSIAHEQYGIQTLGLAVFDFNVAAIKLYERIGFKKTTYKENARKYGDEYWNLWEMDIKTNEVP
ncbi:GNAT family N-acetyltransferase [Alkalihalobacillus pseudalcaliphilus]|uniref:GNAT family N-acetyltransferase n=1 Tax=Alkalihalobacillus pseudalcaliphilus TaxID=79884 RepID=UPI000B155220|nr:GNAT family protein [Alkalihalobacillus pseudalcaliphilus]